jgi:hypothetical protein
MTVQIFLTFFFLLYQVLLQLSSVLNVHLLDHLTKISFTEWGALLLHQEVLSVVRLFDDACDESRFKSTALTATNAVATAAVKNQSTTGNSVSILLSVKEAFAPLIWGLKILTLDQPADIKKYVIPSDVMCDRSDTDSNGYLTESKIRKIMGRRLDFHKDASQNVKIISK